MKNIYHIIISVLVVFLSGCFSGSISQFRSGKVLETGKIRCGSAVGLGENFSSSKKREGPENISLFEAWHQYGIAKGWDFGLKYSFFNSYSFTVRRSIFGENSESRLSGAAGLKYSQRDYSYTNKNDNNTEGNVRDFTLPVYFSRDFTNEKIMVYLIPTLNLRIQKEKDLFSGEKTENKSWMAGGTVGKGVQPLNNFWIMAEYNLLQAINSDEPLHRQGGVGIAVDFDL
ncbi:MAG: hypothetical protein ACQEQC_06540 [Elusimicrobiota bacterium]